MFRTPFLSPFYSRETEKLPDDLQELQKSLARLQSMVDGVYRYVDDVVEGRCKPDATIGRFVAEAIAALPQLGPDALEALFASSVQDVLMVMYLSGLVRAQLALADRLNSHNIALAG